MFTPARADVTEGDPPVELLGEGEAGTVEPI